MKRNRPTHGKKGGFKRDGREPEKEKKGRDKGMRRKT